MKITRLDFLRSLIVFLPLSGVTQVQAGIGDTPSLPNAQLLGWLSKPRIPVIDSPDPVIQTFVAAVLLKQKVEFVYLGGSTPGCRRIVSPSLVFQVDQREEWGPVYVSGYCHLRNEERIFRIDRILLASSLN